MRSKALAWVGGLVSLAVVGVIFTQFDVGEAIAAIGHARFAWLLPAAALYLALFPIRGLRWRLLLRAVRPVPVTTATEVFIVGSMANNLLPARLGDVARAVVLGRRASVPITTTFSNVLLERILDGFTVVGFLSLVLVLSPPDAAWVRSVGATMALLFVAGLFGCCLLAWNERLALRLFAALLAPLPPSLANKIHAKLALLVEGLRVLRSPADTVLVLLLGGVIWSLEVAVYALVANAFGLEIPWSGLTLIMAVLTLGLTAPSAPGFIGVFEGLIVAGASLYGVDTSLGLAFAITMHLIHYVPVTLLGLWFAWRSGVEIKALGETARTPKELEWT